MPGQGSVKGYTARGSGGGEAKLPVRDRLAHADKLTKALTLAVQAGEQLIAARDPALAGGERGFYLEFELPQAQAAILDKLEKREKKSPIELTSVRPLADGKMAATVFVPEKHRAYYMDKVAEYGDPLQDTAKGNPANQPLIASIDTIRLAVAHSLYTDQPASPGEATLPTKS